MSFILALLNEGFFAMYCHCGTKEGLTSHNAAPLATITLDYVAKELSAGTH